VKFDEGMNDLPSKFLLSNQRDLERAKQGDKFPAESEVVNVEEKLQFHVYTFAKMEENRLKVLPMCSRPNFGLKIELGPQYSCAYVLDVDAKLSAAKLFSSLKATRRAIRLSYIVQIAGCCIFTKSEATAALLQIRDEGVGEFHITFANEPILLLQSNDVTMQMSLLYLIHIQSGQAMNCQQMI